MPIRSDIVKPDQPAPDFSLNDIKGQTVTLSAFQGRQNIILVFLRHFLWPFCRRHMAQLRQDYQKFQALDTEILAVAYDNVENSVEYFTQNKLPFPGLVDSSHTVFDQYDVASKAISLGQRPGLFVIDKHGIVQFAHIGSQQYDIPTNKVILKVLEGLPA